MDEGIRRHGHDPLLSACSLVPSVAASSSSLLSLPPPPLEPTLAAAASYGSSSLEDGLDLTAFTALSAAQDLPLLPPAQTTNSFVLLPPLEAELDTHGWGIINSSPPPQSSVPAAKSDERGAGISSSPSSLSSLFPLAGESRDAELDVLAELITETAPLTVEHALPRPPLPPPQPELLPAEFLVTAGRTSPPTSLLLPPPPPYPVLMDEKEHERQGRSSGELGEAAGQEKETTDDPSDRLAGALSSTAPSARRPRAAKRGRAGESQEPNEQQEKPGVAPWSSYLAEERRRNALASRKSRQRRRERLQMLEEQLKQQVARHVQLEQQLRLASLPTNDIISGFSLSLQLAAIKELRIQTVRGIFSAANAKRFSPSTILDKNCVLLEHSKELIGAANILKFWSQTHAQGKYVKNKWRGWKVEALDARGDRCRVEYTSDGLISGDVSPTDSYWRTTLALDDETIVQSTTSDGSNELPSSSTLQLSPSSDRRGPAAEDVTTNDLEKTPSTWVEVPKRMYFIFGTDNRMILLAQGTTPDPVVFRTQLPDGRERRILVQRKKITALDKFSLF